MSISATKDMTTPRAETMIKTGKDIPKLVKIFEFLAKMFKFNLRYGKFCKLYLPVPKAFCQLKCNGRVNI